MIKIKLDGICKVLSSVPNTVLNGYDIIPLACDKSVRAGEGLQTRTKPFLHYYVATKGDF